MFFKEAYLNLGNFEQKSSFLENKGSCRWFVRRILGADEEIQAIEMKP